MCVCVEKAESRKTELEKEEVLMVRAEIEK